jgi:SSS family solute:Na+ symporter
MAYFNTIDYVLFFVMVAVVLFAGFIAYFWRKPKTMSDMNEWGLGGSKF